MLLIGQDLLEIRPIVGRPVTGWRPSRIISLTEEEEEEDWTSTLDVFALVPENEGRRHVFLKGSGLAVHAACTRTEALGSGPQWFRVLEAWTAWTAWTDSPLRHHSQLHCTFLVINIPLLVAPPAGPPL